MKKQLLCFAAALAFTASFAAHIAPIRTMVIPQATSAMVMDADDAETVYSAVQSMDAFNPTGSTGADADFTSTFKVCYDRNYLYFFGKILDEYNNGFVWGGSNQWTYDNFEVFMDLDTNGSGSTPAYDTNTVQIRFNRNVDSCNDAGRAARPDYMYSHDSELPDGWVVEVAIPWKFVLATGQVTEDIMQYLAVGMAHGFDVSGADSDTDGADARDCQTGWDNDEPQDPADRTEDNAWNNRTVFGIITFAPYVESVEVVNSTSAVAYPNPTTGLVNFDGVEGTIEIMNVAGQIVTTGINGQVDLSDVAAGIYVAKTSLGNVKIVKK